MAKNIPSHLKRALRQRMTKEILVKMSSESRKNQSKEVTKLVLKNPAFRIAEHISIYLSTPLEVDTTELLYEMFRLGKQVFVPTCVGDGLMEMVRLHDMNDYARLPYSKWKIKQPSLMEGRENAMTNGHGIDLFLIPGVAFTKSGGRMGHGMGYYDRYIERHYNKYPNKKIALIGLAYREHIVEESILPMEMTDYRLHKIITA